MKRSYTGVLLMALTGVLLVVVIDSNRDPIAVLEEFGAEIKRNDQGKVVEVDLRLNKVNKQGELVEVLKKGITDAGLVHLKGLTNLQTLNGGTKVTDAGAADLQKALPDCRIFNYKKPPISLAVPPPSEDRGSDLAVNGQVLPKVLPPPCSARVFSGFAALSNPAFAGYRRSSEGR